MSSLLFWNVYEYVQNVHYCLNQYCLSRSAWIRYIFLDPDPDTELLFWIRIQQKMTEQIHFFSSSNFRPENSRLFGL